MTSPELLKPDQIQAELLAALPELWGANSPTVSPHSKAFGHPTFRVSSGEQSFLLKIPRLPQEVARLRAVQSLVGLARKTGVRAPAVIAVEDPRPGLGGRPFLLQEFLPGRDAEEGWNALQTRERLELMQAWGREVGVLHQAGGEIFTEGKVSAGDEGHWRAHLESRLEQLIRLHRKNPTVPAEVWKLTLERVGRLIETVSGAVRPTLVHRDLCLRNLLIDDSGRLSALLDFEHARFSDPVWDTVKLEFLVFQLDPALEASFQRGYSQIWPQPWPLQNERLQLGRAFETLGSIPYYQRNRQASALEAELKRLERWLIEV